jgi:uncharacterized protein YoxC
MIKKLTISVKKSESGGIFHDSRHDVRVLSKVCNELINKVNELTDKVNELKTKIK